MFHEALVIFFEIIGKKVFFKWLRGVYFVLYVSSLRGGEGSKPPETPQKNLFIKGKKKNPSLSSKEKLSGGTFVVRPLKKTLIFCVSILYT